jgi:PKD repeat protein
MPRTLTTHHTLIYLLVIVGLLAWAGCQEREEFTFGPLPTGDIRVTVDSVNTLQVSLEAVGVDTAENFVSWDFGYATTTADRTNTLNPTIVYPEAGTYTITLILTGSGGVNGITETITVEAPAGPVYTPQEKLLAGEGSGGKAWRVAAEIEGHSAAARPDGSFFWQRPAAAMECLGMYNDLYIFDLEDFSFTADLGGDIYTRAGFQEEFSNPVSQAEAGCSGLSGNDIVADYLSPPNLSWKLTADANGQPILTLPDGGYIGMGVQQTEYRVIRLEEDLVELTFAQAGGAVVWHVILVPVEGDLSDEQLRLSGFAPSGKTWKVAADVLGHSAAARPDGSFFWQRGSGAMACLGLYNDRYTFTPAGEFRPDYGGDLYARGGFQETFANPVNQADAGCSGLSGNDFVVDYTAPENLTYTLEDDTDGNRQLLLSDGGYIGMAVGQTAYRIQQLSADTLHVTFEQAGGAVIWHKILVPGN